MHACKCLRREYLEKDEIGRYRSYICNGFGAVRPVNHAVPGTGTDVIPTKYRRDTAWRFGALTLGFAGAICKAFRETL